MFIRKLARREKFLNKWEKKASIWRGERANRADVFTRGKTIWLLFTIFLLCCEANTWFRFSKLLAQENQIKLSREQWFQLILQLSGKKFSPAVPIVKNEDDGVSYRVNEVLLWMLVMRMRCDMLPRSSNGGLNVYVD